MFNSNDVCIGVLVLIGFIAFIDYIPSIIKAYYKHKYNKNGEIQEKARSC